MERLHLSIVEHTMEPRFFRQAHKQVIATQSEISGRVDQLQVDSVSVIMGILSNAYIEALRTGLDPTHSLPKPTDTVTTPLSASTEKEEAEPSPAAKK